LLRRQNVFSFSINASDRRFRGSAGGARCGSGSVSRDNTFGGIGKKVADVGLDMLLLEPELDGLWICCGCVLVSSISGGFKSNLVPHKLDVVLRKVFRLQCNVSTHY
jgi:hypothetical protein